MINEALTKALLTPGTVTVVAGRPAMGKTAFALDFSSKLSCDGKNIEYFSFEMTREKLFERLSNKKYSESSFHIIDDTSIGIEKRLKYLENTNLVILDYLQLINENTGDGFIKRIKKTAEKKHFAVLILSQLSRGVERRRIPIPRLSDLPGEYIIDDADNIIFLYRPAYYDYTAKRTEGHLLIAKHTPYNIPADWDSDNVAWNLWKEPAAGVIEDSSPYK